MYTLNKLRNELFLDDEITRVELEKKLARSPSGARSKYSNVRPFLDGMEGSTWAAKFHNCFTCDRIAWLEKDAINRDFFQPPESGSPR